MKNFMRFFKVMLCTTLLMTTNNIISYANDMANDNYINLEDILNNDISTTTNTYTSSMTYSPNIGNDANIDNSTYINIENFLNNSSYLNNNLYLNNDTSTGNSTYIDLDALLNNLGAGSLVTNDGNTNGNYVDLELLLNNLGNSTTTSTNTSTNTNSSSSSSTTNYPEVNGDNYIDLESLLNNLVDSSYTNSNSSTQNDGTGSGTYVDLDELLSNLGSNSQTNTNTSTNTGTGSGAYTGNDATSNNDNYIDLYDLINNSTYFEDGSLSEYIPAKLQSMIDNRQLYPQTAELILTEKISNVYGLIENNSYSVYINGEYAELNNGVVWYEDRTFLPVRELGELLGAEVIWYSDYRVAVLQRIEDNNEFRRIEVPIETSKANVIRGYNVYFDEEVSNIDPLNSMLPSVVVNNNSYLPLRFISENLGYNVTFFPEYKEIQITDMKYAVPVSPIGIY